MRPGQRVMFIVLSFTLGCGGIEVPDGGGGGGSGQPDSGQQGGAEAMALTREWSGCMTLTDFQTAKMNTAWGTLSASNGQACSSCHNNGFEGFYADTDANGMFTAITTTQQFLLQYFLPDVSNHKMIVNQSVFQAVGTNQPPHQGHPSFNPTNNAGMTALHAFYDATLPKQQAHTCDPPRLP